MLRGLEGWHFIVLALVFILLFGAKKLPESARSLAKSLKIFKSEMKNNDKKEE
jgi:sec-independent protein translocase protein TatA